MDKLLWLDMEMTGLNPHSDSVLEIALVVTDFNLEALDSWTTVFYQSDIVLAAMDDWCTKTHTASGLLERVKSSTESLETAEAKMLNFVKLHFPADKAILSGNSIHQDRKFVDKFFPLFRETLHYRMLDVSSFKILFEHQTNSKFKKKNKHTAVEDIEESIEELKHYLRYIPMFNSNFSGSHS